MGEIGRKGGSIKRWPIGERPRERLLEKGPEALTEAQLLAILLRTGIRNQDAVQVGVSLLHRFGGLLALAQSTGAELCRIPGVGAAKAAQLLAAFEIGRRSQSKPLSGKASFRVSQDVYRHFHPLVRELKKEVFRVVLLDSKNKILRHLVISEGSLNLSLVHPREVFKPAIRNSAASVLFVHNHPSGDPGPSDEDIETTGRLAEAGSLLGIRVLDHVIIGDGSFFSFVDQGLLLNEGSKRSRSGRSAVPADPFRPARR